MAKKIPDSAFARARKLFTLSSKVIAKEVSHRVKHQLGKNPMLSERIKQAEAIVETLGELKGAAMKAGQLISVEMSEYLPPEILTILRQLHDKSSHYPIADIRKTIKEDLGAAKFAKLRKLSEEPLAAASIGQVHSALLDGEEVVVKVQYPKIIASIDHDMAIVKKNFESFFVSQ